MEARRLVAPTLILVVAATAIAAKPEIVHRSCTKPGCVCGIPEQNYQYQPRSRSEMAISRTAVLLRKSTTVADEAIDSPATGVELNQVDVADRHTDEGSQRVIVVRRSQGTAKSVTPTTTRLQESVNERTEVLPPPRPTCDPAKPLRIDERSELHDRFVGPPPVPQAWRKTVIDLYQLDQDKLQIDQCEISQVALQLFDNGQWVLSLRGDQNRRPLPDQPVPYNPRLHIKRNQFVVRLRCLGAVEVKPIADAPAAGKPVLVALNPVEFWVENGQPRYLRTGGRDPLVKDYFRDIDRVEIEFFYR
jgi:hypothetical protein